MYDLILANDDTMPAGQDWLFIRHDDGDLLVLRRAAIGDPGLINDLWTAARRAGATIRRDRAA